MDNQRLIDAVVTQIQKDVRRGDLTAVEELVSGLPYQTLLQFLPEDQWINHPQGELSHNGSPFRQQ